MTARTKYTEKLADEICQLLSTGALIEDVSLKLGFSRNTFTNWCNKYPDFGAKVNKAMADAKIGANVVIRRAMAPYDETTVTTKTRTETKLKRNKDGSQEPYNWVSTTQLNTVTHHQGDWRAALEFLKRRDPEHWADRLIVVVEPNQLALLDAAQMTPSILWRLTLALAQACISNGLDVRSSFNGLIGELSGGQIMIDAEVLSDDVDDTI